MKKLIYTYLLLSLVIFISIACNNTQQQASQTPNINSKEFKEKLMDANKKHVKRESDEIDQYVLHKGWKLITTGTGIRYMITKHGTGELAKNNQFAKINYKVSLLDGTVCYTSDSLGSKEFLIGKDNVESGLHEAIQYMHVGDKALVILPSHLAHGLIGDGNKIPAKSSLIYEIELLSLKNVSSD